MSKINTKEFFKVVKIETGLHDYDTVFIEVDGSEVQVPIKKDANKGDLIGKNIKVKSTLVDNKVVFGWTIEKVELM